MHLPDGIVSAPILITAGAVATAGVAYGLKRLQHDEIPKTAVLTSCFFVASLIHIPVPPVSVHFVLPGLLGLLLGWKTFPAVFVGLLMQYLFFGHGGISTLGVNVCTMAIPAVACHYLCRGFVQRSSRGAFIGGLVGGALAVAMSCVLYSGTLFLCGKEFSNIAIASLACHLPIIGVEGLTTAFILSFLAQVRPESLRRHAIESIENLEPIA